MSYCQQRLGSAFGDIAQLVERLAVNQFVLGSSPSIPVPFTAEGKSAAQSLDSDISRQGKEFLFDFLKNFCYNIYMMKKEIIIFIIIFILSIVFTQKLFKETEWEHPICPQCHYNDYMTDFCPHCGYKIE